MSQVPQARWLDAREQRAWKNLQAMQARLTAALAHQLTESSDLSYQDYVVLVVLTEEATRGIRLFELAERLGWERSRLSHHLSRMAERGLVAKEACGQDRRGAYVTATSEGRAAIEEAAPGHVEAVRRLFVDPLTPEQLDAVGEAAAKVLRVIATGEP